MSRNLALALMLAATPMTAEAEEVVVFAAPSLKTALDQIAADWQAETGHSVTLSYGGSNKLAVQIQQGAPADIFLSASSKWMDTVEADGDVVAGSRLDLLGNQLVLIAGPDAAPVTLAPELDLTALLAGGKLSMATVDAVPAGQYGKAALESLGLWEAAAPQVAQSEDVRAALRLVATGEAPYGIVYASDAVAEPAVKVVGTFPADSHPKITYPAALLTGSKDLADQAFLEALSGDKAAEIFAAQGFTRP